MSPNGVLPMATLKASGRAISTFAYQHFRAALLFRDHAGALESTHLDAPFGAFFEDIQSYCSGCIMSGTAALEALLAKRPMVVAYRISSLTYFIVKMFSLMKITHYSLPNVLANEAVVPELMQKNCTAYQIADAIKPMLASPENYTPLMQKFTLIHQHLRRDANHLAADVVLELANPP